MSRHIGAKPQKEPATIPAPATGGYLEAEPVKIGEMPEYKEVQPKKVTKRPRKTAKK